MTHSILDGRDAEGLLLSEEPAGILTAYLSSPLGTSPQSLPVVLRRELARLRTSLGQEPHATRGRFDDAAKRLLEALNLAQPHAPSGTWMAVSTDARLLHDEWLPRVLPTLVAWDSRARIAPFLTSTMGTRGVVAVVDRHHSSVYALAGSSLSETGRWEVDARPVGTAPHMSAPAAPGFHRGTTGTPGADVVARRSDHAADVNLARTRERIRADAGHDGLVVLGGAHEAVARLVNELRPALGDRLLVADALKPGSPLNEVRTVANDLVSSWRAARTDEAVDDALSRASSRMVAVGDDAVLAALGRGAVSRLIITDQRLGERDGRVERMVRLGLGQRATVDVAEGATGQRLSELAGGSVALLRFASAPEQDQSGS